MNTRASARRSVFVHGPLAAGQRVSPWRNAGFTLMEVMIVVVIVAVLTAIAYPTYMRHVVRTQRVAAEGCLSQLSSYMERYYTTYLRYDKAGSASGAAANALPTLDCTSNQQSGRYYTFAFDAGQPTQTTYKINAAPIAGTQQARDSLCGTVSLDQTGQRGKTGVGQLSDCW